MPISTQLNSLHMSSYHIQSYTYIKSIVYIYIHNVQSHCCIFLLVCFLQFFEAVLEKCYENENVFTENVEEIISPVIATDPDGLYQFFLDNQPEKWKVNPDEDQKFDSAQQFDRRLMYYAFRLGAMGYGPGFRLIKKAYRLGQNLENTQGYGTLNLMDNCPPWEERSQFHPGVLDCVLQVGAVRGTPNEYQYSSVIK